MNKYIQDKLLEKHICRFNDGECKCDCYIAGMTDYHNHIVEIVEDCKREDIDEQMEDLQLNIIAETYDTKLQAFYWGGNCMVDKIVPLLKNTLYDKETNN